MKRTNIEVPEHLLQRVVDALDSVGLHVIEYVKSGGFRFQVSEHPPVGGIRTQIPDPDFIPYHLRGGVTP